MNKIAIYRKRIIYFAVHFLSIGHLGNQYKCALTQNCVCQDANTMSEEFKGKQSRAEHNNKLKVLFWALIQFDLHTGLGTVESVLCTQTTKKIDRNRTKSNNTKFTVNVSTYIVACTALHCLCVHGTFRFCVTFAFNARLFLFLK